MTLKNMAQELGGNAIIFVDVEGDNGHGVACGWVVTLAD